ncbi:hypothetical protein [Chryseobacterium taklimakanense]|nr:hypothetical protein [Chryseobacterium taklimakanense]
MAAQNAGKLDAKVFDMSGKNIMTKKSSGDNWISTCQRSEAASIS